MSENNGAFWTRILYPKKSYPKDVEMAMVAIIYLRPSVKLFESSSEFQLVLFEDREIIRITLLPDEQGISCSG